MKALANLAILRHVIGDILNNLAVVVSSLIVIYAPPYSDDAIYGSAVPVKYYADPVTTLFIAIAIMWTSIPLIKKSGMFLMDTAPAELDLPGLQKSLEKIGDERERPPSLDEDDEEMERRRLRIRRVHELHVWRLCEGKIVGMAHLVLGRRGEGKSWGEVAVERRTISVVRKSSNAEAQLFDSPRVRSPQNGLATISEKSASEEADNNPRKVDTKLIGVDIGLALDGAFESEQQSHGPESVDSKEGRKVDVTQVDSIVNKARDILHNYGLHNITLQVELELELEHEEDDSSHNESPSTGHHNTHAIGLIDQIDGNPSDEHVSKSREQPAESEKRGGKVKHPKACRAVCVSGCDALRCCD